MGAVFTLRVCIEKHITISIREEEFSGFYFLYNLHYRSICMVDIQKR